MRDEADAHYGGLEELTALPTFELLINGAAERVELQLSGKDDSKT